MKKAFFILLFVFAIIFAATANAQPPFQTTNQDGLEIAYTAFESIKINQDFDLNIHVYNNSNGYPLTNETVDCEIDLYRSNGSEFLSSDLKYSDEFYLNIKAGNFSYVGENAYIISCNTSTFGGFVFGNFYITKSGDDQEFMDVYGFRTIAMIIGLCLVAFIFLYFAFQLTQEHFILKIFMIFFSLITLKIIPAVATNGYDGLGLSFMKTVDRSFYIFVVYFTIYLFWHWCQKSEKMMAWINKAKSTFKRR